MDHLDLLEAESVSILRETAAQFRAPALMFSGGKDSITMIHLAVRAFSTEPFPFTLIQIDTGQNFAEADLFRDALVRKLGARLLVQPVRAEGVTGVGRNALQSVTLMETLRQEGFDALIGGARRDEEKARAKERIFSIRDAKGAWDPANQRPELWHFLNGRLREGQHMRVFPLSNWTELDVWAYILREQIALPEIYFAHRRLCVRKLDGTLLAHSPFVSVDAGDTVEELTVRCRTVGDLSSTGLVESTATTLEDVVEELRRSRISERGTRVDDRVSETAMEDRKRQGYF